MFGLGAVAAGTARVGSGAGRILRRLRPGRTPASPSIPAAGGTTPSGIIIPPSYGRPRVTGAGATAPAAPAAASSVTRQGSILFGPQGGAGGPIRSALPGAANVVRQLPGGLVGLGAAGAGLAYGARSLYNRFNPQEEARLQALAALGDLEGGPQRMEQEVLDEYMQPFRQGFTPDTEWEAEVRRQAAQQQSMLGGYGDRAGSAISGAYQDVANRGAADAAALQALAEQTGLTIGQLAEAGAGDVEGMLYGGDMDVSGTSGLTPLPSYLADSPDQMRAIGDAAAESALRNLSLDARGFVDESNIMSQMGPAMAQQLQNEMALRQFDVGREAESLIRDDRRDRRRSAEDLERAALFNWAEMQSQRRAAEIEDRARKEQAVRELAVSNPKLIQTLYRKWNEGDQAVWEAQGFDFFDYVVSSARI